MTTSIVGRFNLTILLSTTIDTINGFHDMIEIDANTGFGRCSSLVLLIPYMRVDFSSEATIIINLTIFFILAVN